jgi:hypothetical protein
VIRHGFDHEISSSSKMKKGMNVQADVDISAARGPAVQSHSLAASDFHLLL